MTRQEQIRHVLAALQLEDRAGEVVAVRVDIDAGEPTWVDVRFALSARQADALFGAPSDPAEGYRDPVASIHCWAGRHEQCQGTAYQVADGAPCECHCHQSPGSITLSN